MLRAYSLFSLTLTLCVGNVSAEPLISDQSSTNIATQNNKAADNSALMDYLTNNSGNLDDITSKNTQDFYKNNDYKAVWYPNGQESKAAKVALQVLKSADDEGLNSKNYNEIKMPASTPSWVSKDVQLTARFLKYIHDLRVGRVDPKHIARFIKVSTYPTKPVELLTEALNDSSHNYKGLKEMAPELEDYRKLKSLLRAYRIILKKNKELAPLQLRSKDLEVETSNPEIVKLKKRLQLLGFMKGNDHTSLFDEKTEKALKEFQKFHSIDVDGKIGKDTLRALNWPLEERINKIIANMERLRWLPDHLGSRFIMVNVGGYEVLAVHDGKVEHRIKAIVGQKGRRTPLFYATLKNIIINPSWGVPTSILIKDKIPRIANDPGYLAKAGFTVTDGSGHRVDPYSVDWLNNGAHMHLRQSPGAHNALGRLKFNITTPGSNTNPYTVYMHGTPIDKLFKKGVRNFSSGCVRLEKPTVLAAWVLEEENGWDVDDIKSRISKGRTQTLSIKNDIPVYFTYMTVWVDDKGRSHFSPDAYDIDDTLIEALDT